LRRLPGLLLIDGIPVAAITLASSFSFIPKTADVIGPPRLYQFLPLQGRAKLRFLLSRGLRVDVVNIREQLRTLRESICSPELTSLRQRLRRHDQVFDSRPALNAGTGCPDGNHCPAPCFVPPQVYSDAEWVSLLRFRGVGLEIAVTLAPFHLFAARWPEG